MKKTEKKNTKAGEWWNGWTTTIYTSNTGPKNKKKYPCPR